MILKAVDFAAAKKFFYIFEKNLLQKRKKYAIILVLRMRK